MSTLLTTVPAESRNKIAPVIEEIVTLLKDLDCIVQMTSANAISKFAEHCKSGILYGPFR